MNSRAEQLRSLFDELLPLPAEARAERLAEQEAPPELADELRELLRFAEAEGGPLDTPLLDRATLDRAREASREPEPTPASVGPYEIVRRLGEGATGVVYEALQANPRRTVALKLLRRGLLDEPARRRFQLEVDALGRLDHPYIAAIYEAGSVELADGPRPYLVMELVEGRPLSQAPRGGRGLRERLELLARLGAGVAHAHSRGVVHRDLKPENVLVDEQGRPHILDFSVARLIDPAGTAAARSTAQGVLVGTLQYMSPEQAAGDASRLDTRSDVYALGVLGYELLAGRPPYELDGLDLPGALRCIAEERGPLAGAQRPELRGDVEAILAKALSKDPDRRYQSAAEFVADLHRYLADEPILARSPGAADALRRWARRHRALAVGSAVGLLLMLVGLAAMAWGLNEARERAASNLLLLERERLARQAEQAALISLRSEQAASQAARERAETALRDAETLADFATGLLLSVQPEQQGWDVRLSSVLDAAAARAQAWSVTPWVAARVDETLGRAYMAVGRHAQARPHLERALELWRELEGDDSLVALKAQAALGSAVHELADGAATLALQSDRLERARRVWGRDDERALRAELDLARAEHLTARYEPGAARFTELIQRASAALGEQHELVAEARFGAARLEVSEGRYANGRELLLQVLAARRESLGDDHLQTLEVLRELAMLEAQRGDVAQARLVTDAVHAALLRRLGPEHPRTLASVADQARWWERLGETDKALAAYAEAIEGLTRVAGPRHGLTLLTRKRHAGLLTRLDRLEQAETALDALIALGDTDAAPADWWLSARRERGFLRMRRGELPGARADMQSTLEDMRSYFGPGHIEIANMLMDLSNLEMNERRFAAAELQLAEAESIYRAAFGEDHADVLAAQMNRASGYLASGRPDEAERVLSDVLARAPELLSEAHSLPLRGRTWLADAWVQLGRTDAALELLPALLAELTARFGPTHELTLRARFVQLDGLQQAGRLAEASARLAQLDADLAATPGARPERRNLALREAQQLRFAGDLDAARQLLEQALAYGTPEPAAISGETWGLHIELARVFVLGGRPEAAREHLQTLHAAALAAWGERNFEAREAAAALVELHSRLGDADAAAIWRARVGDGDPEPPVFLHE